MAKKITLELTELELLALTDSLDNYAALAEGIEDGGVAIKDLKKVDKMLNKNGYKRAYS